MRHKRRIATSVKNGFLLIGLFLMITCCLGMKAESKQDKKQGSQVPAKAQQNPGEAPRVKFQELSHDFGKSAQNASLKYAFNFKNEGKGTLIIENVKAS